MDVQKLANNYLGITFDTAKTGSYADFETISRPKTDQELALAQARVDDLYQKFLTKVSESRNIPLDTLQTIAQGRVWSGSEALKLNLIDEIGSLDDAIACAAQKAKLGTRLGDYRVKEYPEEMTFAESLALLFNNQEEPVTRAKADPLTR
jgi:protease-4